MVTRTYEVRTHGCQMNVHDSARIAGLLDGRATPGRTARSRTSSCSAPAPCARTPTTSSTATSATPLVKDRTPGMQIAVGLRRMFSALAGMPLSEYVRRRRMTSRHRRSSRGSGTLLGIAVRYGYGSAEVFGRGVPVRTWRQPGPTHGKAHLLDDHPARRLRRGGGGATSAPGRGPGPAAPSREGQKPTRGGRGGPPGGPHRRGGGRAGGPPLPPGGSACGPGMGGGRSAGGKTPK